VSDKERGRRRRGTARRRARCPRPWGNYGSRSRNSSRVVSVVVAAGRRGSRPFPLRELDRPSTARAQEDPAPAEVRLVVRVRPSPHARAKRAWRTSPGCGIRVRAVGRTGLHQQTSTGGVSRSAEPASTHPADPQPTITEVVHFPLRISTRRPRHQNAGTAAAKSSPMCPRAMPGPRSNLEGK